MKQSKFSLADVLSVLTALVFGFICFLGKNFSTLGDTSASIIWGAIIAGSLTVTAFVAKQLKRASGNFRTNFILEVIVLLLFTGLTVFFAYSSFPHYFNVTAKKSEIQNKLQASITQAENMFVMYEQYVEVRKNLYKGNLQSAVDAKAQGIDHTDYDNYRFVNGQAPDNIQIDNKMFTIHTLLFPPNYSDTSSNKGIKEVATNWLKNAKNITNNWNPISIVSVINDVEKNSMNWRTQLINLSKERGVGENYFDFDQKLSFDNVKKYFTMDEKPTMLTITLATVAYLLMLLSYIVSKRSSKSTVGITNEKGKYDIDY